MGRKAAKALKATPSHISAAHLVYTVLAAHYHLRIGQSCSSDWHSTPPPSTPPTLTPTPRSLGWHRLHICGARLHMNLVYGSKSLSPPLLSPPPPSSPPVVCVWANMLCPCIHSVWSRRRDKHRLASLHSLSVNDAEIISPRHNKNIHPPEP